jgi:hypothetical protein
MDRIEPIRPSLPPIDATRVRKVVDERERGGAGQDAQRRQPRRRSAQEGEGREWIADEELQDTQDSEDPDGPPRFDVRA